ncbi:MAG TPA: translation initiation factor IF-2 N-terminal domain-containing protein, partial [Sphingomonas sp.]|nr:translation initiation factor IF-2 N-terminal domain-containing protein [Sphingomonas sp.]
MRQPLGLKRTVETGKVKQSFSHGRSNTVVVEVKRRRVLGPQSGQPEAAPEPVVEAAPPPPSPAPAPRPSAPAGETAQERQARMLREAEEQRMQTNEDARRREERERVEAAEAEARRAEEKARAEAEAAKAPKEEPKPEPAPAPVVEAAPPPAPASAPTPAPAPAPVPPKPIAVQLDPSRPAPRQFTPVQRPEIPRPAPARPEPNLAANNTGSAAPAPRPAGGANLGPNRAPARPPEPQRPQQRDRKGDERRGGKLTVNRALGGDDGARARSLAALKRAREKEHRRHSGPREPQAKQVRDVQVPDAITVSELANRMAEKGADLVKALFKMGMPVTLTQTIDQDTAELLVTEFGHNIVRVSDSDIDLATDTIEDAPETLKTRPPVVT